RAVLTLSFRRGTVPPRTVAGKVDGQPREQSSKPDPRLRKPALPELLRDVAPNPALPVGKNPVPDTPFPSERCKRPFPNPAVPFVSRWFLFTQKNYDFESRANAVIATVRAGSSLADIASRESFVGIAVAYPSVRSRILPRPRVERLS